MVTASGRPLAWTFRRPRIDGEWAKFTVGVVLTALALIAFLSLAQYTRKVAVPGVLAPDRGLIRVVPSASGTVVERRVGEGQAVRAGDVLFVISIERSTLDVGAAVNPGAARRSRRANGGELQLPRPQDV